MAERTGDSTTMGSPRTRVVGLPVRAALVLLPLAACAGPQSALDPAGEAAAEISTLWWTMAVAGGIVWLVVIGLTVYAIRVAPERTEPRRDARRFILGGTLMTVGALTALLLVGLSSLPDLLEAPDDALRVHVTGEEFWWRITYVRESAAGPGSPDSIEVANELRLPVDRPALLTFETADVIHSFWLPSLAGKIDLMPGRVTRLLLEPTRRGRYRGACAEFCGLSHAFMQFTAVVDDSAGFAAWLDRQASPAVGSGNDTEGDALDPAAVRGREAFARHGCAACHRIRGTAAGGRIGPDLTHVGGRPTLGAGRLPNHAEAREEWIREAPRIKPGIHMPAFAALPDEDVRAIATYLGGLE